MQAIVLAGGFGTRLKKVVADLPKPMAPIGQRPFLEIVLRFLEQSRFDRTVLSLGYMADKIIGHFGSRYGSMELTYVVEDTPLGTGGAVRLAMEQCSQDHVFVFNGDTYLDLDVAAVESQWQARRKPIIVGRIVPDRERYGSLLTAANEVTGFAEKGMSGPGLINAGCYVLNKDLLNGFKVNQPFSLENDYLAPAVLKTPFDLFVTDGHFIDIGVPEDYERAQTELAER